MADNKGHAEVKSPEGKHESRFEGNIHIDHNSLTKSKYPETTSVSYEVKKVYPSIMELSTINNSIQCTEENCKEIFTSQSNLDLHLYKTHSKKGAFQFDVSIIKEFHCPVSQCVYNEEQCFKNKNC
ncbi:hypothetical protein HHI36_019868 [Cryptolaemus montrouzieri]|uniref:C2H2-type domain-containing protein n=1 Tax=Cryptolaemus montrouzieri TaxID=559131 RepID=A0ABD2N9C4_9CUCU